MGIVGSDAGPIDVAGDVSIKMALGDDAVMIADATLGGQLTIDLGPGTSSVEIAAASVAKDASIKAPNVAVGEEQPVEHIVEIYGSQFLSKLTVALGQGDAAVEIVDTTVVKDVSVTTKDGTDSIEIMTTVEEVLTAGEAEAGAEGPAFQGKLTVDTGKGDDDVSLVRVTVQKDLSIKTGDGEDYVGIASDELDEEAIGVPADADPTPTTVNGKTAIDLGSGPGELWIVGATFVKDVAVKSSSAASTEEGESWGGVHVGLSTFWGNLSVTTGKAHDVVDLWGCMVERDVTVKTSDGDDEVGVYATYDDSGDVGTPSTIKGSLNVDVGKGASGIWLDAATVKKDFSFRALDAEDTGIDDPSGEFGFEHEACIRNSTIEGKLNFDVGKGDAAVSLSGVTVNKDVAVKTKGGNDVVGLAPLWDDAESEEFAALAEDVASAFGGKVTVDTGAGNDLVVVSESDVTAGLTIKTGDGDDDVALVDVTLGLIDEETEAILVRANLDVNTGHGDDRIGIAGLSATGNVTLNSGNATLAPVDEAEGEDDYDDQVAITNSLIFGNATITTGTGFDVVGIGVDDAFNDTLAGLLEEACGYEIVAGSVDVLGKATIATGNGDDLLAIGDTSVGGFVSVDTGGGDDDASVRGASADSGASFKTGAGNWDYLLIADTWVAPDTKLTLDGGAGTDDTFEDGGGNEHPDTLPKFEHIIPFIN